MEMYFLFQEAIVIILDVGLSVSQDTESLKSGFLEKARQCVSMILKRKVRYICSPSDVLCYVLILQIWLSS
jgi:hypothetical protein